MSDANENKTSPYYILPGLLIRLGLLLVIVSGILSLVFFYPALKENLKFLLFRPNPNLPVVIDSLSNDGKKAIIPVDTEFGIVIPKIGANSKVVTNVDAFDPEKYQLALTEGVAHAEGTVFPGQIGNVFLFSHSSVNFYQADKYNSVFYLADKLERGDEFILIHNKVAYRYVVEEKKIVNPADVSYLSSNSIGDKTATLMTCWPAGTNLKRLLVIGKLAN